MCDLTRNSLICHKCSQEIVSQTRHDFQWCKCGNVFIDGGLEPYAPRFGGKALEDNSFTLTTAYGLCVDRNCWRRMFAKDQDESNTFAGDVLIDGCNA